jgi:hypothetical protein
LKIQGITNGLEFDHKANPITVLTKQKEQTKWPALLFYTINYSLVTLPDQTSHLKPVHVVAEFYLSACKLLR